jgi:hypothetical protein
MVAPPLSAGAVHDTVAEPFPGVAELSVGASGMVAGTIEPDGEEVALLPALLVATTVKAYDMPLPNPSTTHGLVEHVAVSPPGDAVTV